MVNVLYKVPVQLNRASYAAVYSDSSMYCEIILMIQLHSYIAIAMNMMQFLALTTYECIT